MKRERVKNYWSKKKETYNTGREARARAASLRVHAHTAHISFDREGDVYVVRYSAAKWWLEELERAGITL